MTRVLEGPFHLLSFVVVRDIIREGYLSVGILPLVGLLESGDIFPRGLYGDIISVMLPQGDPDRGPKSQVDGGLPLLQGLRAGAVPLEDRLAIMAGGTVLSSRVSRAVLDIAEPVGLG